MTYPGWEGVKGPGWLSTTGFQVRQSKVGGEPHGFPKLYYRSVLKSMGSNAPALGEAAALIHVLAEVAENPHPIEAENFELDFDQAPDFGSPEDYTGLGGS